MPKVSPKTSSFKKKKYNSRFPPARIKKIMQTDEDVGKVAATVPVIISRALEMFIESLILKTAEMTQEKNAKTLSTSHIKQIIGAEKQFDFLRDLVKNVPDHQVEDTGTNGNGNSNGNNGEVSQPHAVVDPPVKRGRGRPRKSTEIQKPPLRKHSNTKASLESSDEDEDDEEDDDEDTETDEESSKVNPTANSSSDRLLPVQPAEHSSNGTEFYQPSYSGSTYPVPMPSAPMPMVPDYQHHQQQLPSQAHMISSHIPPIPNQPHSYMNPQFHLPPPPSVEQQQMMPLNLSNTFMPPPPPAGFGSAKEDDDYDS